MDEFLNWCRARGYEFDGIEISSPPASFGNGVFAKQQFRDGNVIISVPEYDMITAGFVVDLPFYRKLLKNISEKLKPMEILTLFFCFEQSGESAWTPYLNVLPEEFNTPAYLGIQYDPVHLPLAIRKYWVEQKKEIEEITDKLQRIFPELEQKRIMWAWHVVNTRCIFVENEEHEKVDNSDGDTIAVIPLVDMLNHDPTKFQGVALHEKIDGRYVVRAKRSVGDGEQVFVCYGPHDNARLLVEYGFQMGELNPNAKVVVPQEMLVTLAKIAGIRVTREHEMVLEECGLPSHLYATDEGPSWSLRNNIRIMLLQHDQMVNGRWKKIIYSHDPIDEETDCIIDEKCEIILRELRNGIVEKATKMGPDVKWMWDEQIRVCDVAIESFSKKPEN